MATAEGNELTEYLEALKAATLAGKLAWRAANPTTYVWDTADPQPTRLSLQEAEKGEIRYVKAPPPSNANSMQYVTVKNYKLELVDTSNKRVMLAVDSEKQRDLTAALGELFRAAASGINRQGLDLLKRLIPK